MSNSNSNGRIIIGSILIFMGLLFFLRNFEFHFFSINIFSWPVLFLIIGIIILANHKDSFFGILLIIVGGAGIASRYLGISFRGIFVEYWPFLLILIGLYTISLAFGKSKNDPESLESEQNVIDIFSIFGNKTKFIKSNNFLGGKTTSIFGDLKIDLRNCQINNNAIEIDTLTLFGATGFSIPNDWEVIIKMTTIFGGLDDQRTSQQKLEDDSKKVLVLKGIVLFGGFEIKN